ETVTEPVDVISVADTSIVAPVSVRPFSETVPLALPPLKQPCITARPCVTCVAHEAAGAPEVAGRPPGGGGGPTIPGGGGGGGGVGVGVGCASSLTIVTVAVAAPSVASTGFASRIENVSSPSYATSPSTSTLTYCVVCPGWNVTWPCAAR